MVLKSSTVVIILSLFFATKTLEAKIILSELLTKQAVGNIRFLTRDGRFTYYQKNSGALLFSTNYKVQETLRGEAGTMYSIFSTSARRKMIILQNVNFHKNYSLRSKENIFLVNYGENVAREIGMGISPTLLLDDSWLSFYDPYSKILSFENTSNSALKFTIKLNNRINPYFTPQVLMSDENTVYYTDLSENGNYGILEFKRNTAKSEIIYKAPSPMMKAEICLNEGKLILGLFGIHFSKLGSSISIASLPLKDFSKRNVIYNSELNDLGHLLCNFDKDNIVFIKDFGNFNSPTNDIASLNTNDKIITQLSEMKTISNVINMDGILLTQEKGRNYIVKGDVDYKNVDTLKLKPNKLPLIKTEEKELENE